MSAIKLNGWRRQRQSRSGIAAGSLGSRGQESSPAQTNSSPQLGSPACEDALKLFARWIVLCCFIETVEEMTSIVPTELLAFEHVLPSQLLEDDTDF